MKLVTAVFAIMLMPFAQAWGQWHMGFDLSRFQSEGGYVLLLRSADAPGVGEPEGFRIDDCSTQRNLSDEGRRHARYIGEQLRRIGFSAGGTKVLTSRWCRGRETAALLNFGMPMDFAGLDLLADAPASREAALEELRKLLKSLPTDGPPVIMVTHQSTIAAVTGDGLAPGEGRVLKLDGTGQPRLVSYFRVRPAVDGLLNRDAARPMVQ